MKTKQPSIDHPASSNAPAGPAPRERSLRPHRLAALVALTLVAGTLLAADGLDPKSITVKASAWEQKAHGGFGDFPPELTLDGNLAPKSSWRAEGDGAWIEYNLGAARTLSGVELAFFKGAARQYGFAVQVSDSGKENDWKTVLSRRQSSGKSDRLEAYAFAAPVAAQYVRIVGYGSTDEKFAKWICLLETSFLLAPPAGK